MRRYTCIARSKLINLEDLYLAERALQEIRAGKVKTTPLADVMREYGLED